ncbi:MAG: hypothetical protein A2Y62_16540 [Candidatus Fischerbacteria bacterium RBG_13_37_8]|uniref:Glycosyltransferase n=1 Tax=Candidatus Fischerbacteria bacterium RBG_13_37_8 TaxID=1817863 RepID=A0A1F5VP08_9BACT|nr:MAG: hypothetical protein A2Y62_16540 [Candidatus Fischerbacteria bacterium RBG_13_37_8]
MIIVDTMTIGGTEKLTAFLANRFAEKNHETSLLILKNDFSSLEWVKKEKITIHTAIRRFTFDPSYLLKIARTMKEINPDIVLCQGLFSYFSTKTAFCTSSKKYPIVLALHFTKEIRIKDKFFNTIYFTLLKSSPDNIITIYRNQMNYFSKKYGIPLSRFHCIHNGIDVKYFQNKNDTENNDFTIIHIGNIREEKDQMTLLKALKIFNNSFEKWRLIFCGRDLINKKNAFIKYLKNVDLISKVIFIDFVKDIRVLLKKSDVFILSSLSEALPVSALEAMAMSVPCILTNVGGCSDIITEGVNGFLVPAKNPELIAERLLFLAKNPHALKIMKQNAPLIVQQKFSLDYMVDKYINFFEKITKHKDKQHEYR